MKKQWTSLVLAVAAILLLAGCGSSGLIPKLDTGSEDGADSAVESAVDPEDAGEETQEDESELPTAESILSDLPEELQSISINDPLQGQATILPATAVELERRLTEGTSDTAYYKITYENDTCIAIRYMTFYSTNYTVGGWILDSYEPYESNEVFLKANPFDYNDVYAMLSSPGYDAFELSEPIVDSSGFVIYSYVGTNYHTYVDETTEGEYSFILVGDELSWFVEQEEYTSYDWDIAGTWEWTDFTMTLDNPLSNGVWGFSLTIDSFDSDTLTGTGSCTVTNRYPNSDSFLDIDLSKYCDFADSEIRIAYVEEEAADWPSHYGIASTGDYWLEIDCNDSDGHYVCRVYVSLDEAVALCSFGYGIVTRS